MLFSPLIAKNEKKEAKIKGMIAACFIAFVTSNSPVCVCY